IHLITTICQPVPDSTIVHTVDEAVDFDNKIGYPITVRPAFTMGGSGGGICEDHASLEKVVKNGLILSPVTQCLIENSIAGYQEIEDRKSTRLNSSHVSISYAVFCLKTKTKA